MIALISSIVEMVYFTFKVGRVKIVEMVYFTSKAGRVN